MYIPLNIFIIYPVIFTYNSICEGVLTIYVHNIGILA